MAENTRKPEVPRSRILRDYGVIQSRHWPEFDEHVRQAAIACGTPIAALSFIDQECEWFVSSYGFIFDHLERDRSLGERVLGRSSPLVLDLAYDIRQIPELPPCPLVLERPRIRFYAGLPVRSPEGIDIGVLAVMHRDRHELADAQLERLNDIGSAIVDMLEQRRLQCSLVAGSNEPMQAEQSRFHRLVEAAPVAWFIYEPEEFRIVGASDAMLKITGTVREEIIGKRFDEAFPENPSDPASSEGVNNLGESLGRVRTSYQPDRLPLQRYPIPVRGSERFEERYWNVINAPVFDEHGKLEYIVNHVEDITEVVRADRNRSRSEKETRSLRERAEKLEEQVNRHGRELNHLNDHLRLAQRVAEVGSWQLDMKDGTRIWSDEMYRLTGTTPRMKDQGLDALLEVVPPEDRYKLVEARERLFSGESLEEEIEHRVIMPDGDIRHVRERANVRLGEDGKPDILYGTLQDVTEQKLAARDNERRARQQAAAATLGRQALRMESLHALWNEAVQLVAGTLEVEYCKILQLLPGQDAVKLVAGVGWQEGLVGNAVVGIDLDSQAGYTLKSNGPVIVEDLRDETRFSGPTLLRDHGVVSGISVIIQGKDGPWGVLGAHTMQRRTFTEDDVNFFQTIANIIAEANQRSQADEAIRDNEQRLRSILETALDAVVTIDSHSTVTDWNPRAEQIFGWSAAEAIGRPLHELIIPEEYRDAHVKGVRRFVDTGTGPFLNRRLELDALDREGQRFPVELSISPLHTREGLNFSGFLRDISERKRNEAALRESENRFRVVARATADTIWDWNLLTDQVWWNEGMRTVFGYTAQEIEPDSRSFTNRIHPPDSARVLALVREVIESNRDEWDAEYGFLRKDGTVADVEVRGFVVRDESGRAIRMVGAMNDVTEKREYERRLERQAALLDKAQDAIIVRDLDDRILFWNRGAERIYGWTAKEAQGRTKRELLRSDPEVHEDAVRTLLETGEWSGRLQQRRKGGSTLVVEAAWSLVTDDNGNPEAVLTIDTDITERLALEEQLRQSQRLEAVGQLTGGVAHDFNNLLTVILGNAELMADQLHETPRLHRLAEMTRTAAMRGAELTHRLLAFARRQALEPKSIDVNNLVIGMESLLRRALPENIDIEVVTNDELWGAFVDPAQLESVLLNLALNAKDAMANGGQLTIETCNTRLDEDYAARHAEVAPGRYVMIAVSDTGTGIPPELVKQVFDPFFTTKEKGKGTGLGLSMAYGFAKQSGGHIKIYSETDQGTTVKLYLPRAHDYVEVADRNTQSDELLTGDETVLIVEDNDLVRAHAESQLEEFGYKVLAASSGPEALEVIKQKPDIDLLFTDVIMSGGMNGRELVETARKLRPKLKVLYTSGYTENAIVHHGRLDQGVNLLQKPYRRRELARKVRSVLSQQDGEPRPGTAR